MPLFAPSSTLTTATPAQYVAGQPGPFLTPAVVWSAGAEVALGFAATITVDLSTTINANILAAGNFVLANPANAKPGQSGRIRIVQDATGSRTITYGSAWKRAATDSGALSTAPGTVDILYYDVIDLGTVVYTIRRGVA